MKNYSLFTLGAVAVLSVAASCSTRIDLPLGEISFSFKNASVIQTKASSEMPDTNDFILTVTDSSGDVLYNGSYGSAPETISLPSGSYSIDVVSREFISPMFDAPLFGDNRIVLVSAGKRSLVTLDCKRMNCGVKMNIVPEFLDAYPDASLFLTSDSGKLMYSYSEKRTAYFKPGNVSLMMSRGSEDEILRTRWMDAGEMLSLNISVASSEPVSGDADTQLSIQLDTSAIWIEEDYVLGEYGSRGSCPENAYHVNEVKNAVGKKDVWVFGYIVGGDLTSASANFTAPFKSDNNLLLAARSSVTDRLSCISVQLPKGNVRDAMGLMTNPEVLGRAVYLKGDVVEQYYGLCGIKDVSDYKFTE